MNILIVKLSAIGDVIHTLPALNALRRHFPRARITWLVEEAASGLVVGHRALDRVLVSGRKRWLKKIGATHLKEMGRFVRNLRDTRYDVILDFQALLKSSLPIALARGDRKIGFDRGMEHMEHSYLMLSERVPPVSMEIHAIERNLKMIEPLGIRTDRVVYDLPVSGADRETARSLLESAGMDRRRRLVAINPMAKWPTKLWITGRFSRLADRIRQRTGAEILFTGGPEDRGAVARIIAGMDSPAANLAGMTSLKTLAALYESIDLLVSTDTGPMHLGAALGIPVVALFGPTAPWRTGPYGRECRTVRSGTECSPCFQRKCETMLCMERISVERVLEAAEAALAGKIPSRT